MTAAIFESIEQHRLFGQSQRLVRTLPFALAYLAAFATMPLDPVRFGWQLATGVALAAAVLALVAFAPWRRLPQAVDLLPLLLYLASVGLLREAAGGPRSGYAPLVMLAVLWAAIFGRAELVVIVVVAIGLTLAVPQALVGPPTYANAELRRALLMTLMAALAGFVIQALVAALVSELKRREEAERQLTELRANEIHDDIVQSITAATLGLAVNDRAAADAALAHALASAQGIVAELFVAAGKRSSPGQLRRRSASPGSASPGSASPGSVAPRP